ncbi:uncharacterized protein LOC108698216 [Xenopus laevis]|uniref:Uncharacterized protein LOC108698216 n=2 Tax=Xenopus laevis TaxID=8355 RepID=A0A1L8F698_XENLA|nr:uncharacterized protein LOC108698216 [Xenopus laevis]XP_018085021.1 uncharacterized protein LOC108698216 [Xenopus laevis]OCT67106.1 hypothetical protein XELAEV_18038388mg [Xenopus laevis]
MTSRWKLLVVSVLVTVYFNLPATRDSNDLYECTEFRNLSVSEGQDAVIYPDILASKNYSIRSPKFLMFEVEQGRVKKKCPKDKCVCKKSAAIRRNIQLNESGIYTVKFDFNQTVCINITVSAFIEHPTPFVVPQDVRVGNGTTFDQKNENASNVIIGVAVPIGVIALTIGGVALIIGVIAITITAIVWRQRKKNRTWCFRQSVVANCDPSVQYTQCNGRDPEINISVPTPE